MESIPFSIEQAAGAIALILGGLITGLLLERLGLRRLLPSDDTTVRWQGQRVLSTALRGMLLFWCTLAGIYSAIIYVPLDDELTSFGLQMIQVLFILSVTVFVIRVGVGLIDSSNEARGVTGTTVSLSRSLVTAIVLLIGVLVMFQSLGIPITPMIAALGIGGLAISLALEDTLSNVFSGLYLIASRQARPGDYVRLKVDERDHVEGYILDITWRSTKIRAMPTRMIPDAEPSVVIVPNSRMASDIVVIHSRAFTEQEIVIEVSIAAGNDLDYIERITMQTASAAIQEVLGDAPDMPPLVRYASFTPARVDLKILIYGDETVDQNHIKHEVIKQLYRRCQREGIAVLHSHSPDGSLSGQPSRLTPHDE